MERRERIMRIEFTERTNALIMLLGVFGSAYKENMAAMFFSIAGTIGWYRAYSLVKDLKRSKK